MTTSPPPRTNIFFAGTVHEAIATSVQQHFPLVCFVTDGGDESKLWESEYLIDTEIFELLRSDVILLRLQAGSPEAALLAEVCPVKEIPHLLIIRDGALLAKLTAGASQHEFTDAVKNALTRPSTTAATTTAAAAAAASPSPYPAPVHPVASAAPAPQFTVPQRTTVPVASPISPSSPAPGFPSPRREHTASPTPTPTAETGTALPGRRGSIRPESQSYIEQQRQKKLAEQFERQRILQLLENDKAERRLRERERRGEAITPRSESPRQRSAEPPSSEVALSFRLTDGSNIKSRFPASAVLGVDVRAWIEQNRTDGDHPYNFMEILGPSHNRPLSISDENLQLSNLFKRSATLVLVPTQTYTSAAYESASSTGHGLLSQAYGLISSVASAVWSLGSFAPRTEEPPPPPPPRREGRRVGTSLGARVGTLRDEGDDGAEKKYYNGNQLSFEPKPDGN